MPESLISPFVLTPKRTCRKSLSPTTILHERLHAFQIESYLREAKIARLCILNEDGSIHAVPVWYLYRNGRLRMVTAKHSRKQRNVSRSRNVAVLADSSDSESNQPQGIVIYGRAEIGDWVDPKDPDVLSLFGKYMPQEETESFANAQFSLASCLNITIKPTRIGSFDYKKDKRIQTDDSPDSNNLPTRSVAD